MLTPERCERLADEFDFRVTKPGTEYYTDVSLALRIAAAALEVHRIEIEIEGYGPPRCETERCACDDCADLHLDALLIRHTEAQARLTALCEEARG